MWPKVENTLEFKAKFYTLYWGQEICVWPELENLKEVRTKVLSELDENDYLLLKCTDSLSDEDINVCYNLYCAYVAYDGTMDFKPQDEMAKHWYENEGLSVIDDVPILVDYLRSKGYALPYLTLSVAEQITYGWIKLKNF